MKTKAAITHSVQAGGTVSQYEHKGVKINFEVVRARFCADLNGTRIFAPSLDSMRKKIEEHQAMKFEAFDIIDARYDSVDSVRIIDLRRSTYGSKNFVFVNGEGREYTHVTPHTPKNMEMVKASLQLTKANRAKIEKLNAEIEKARNAIPFVRAADYRYKGAKS